MFTEWATSNDSGGSGGLELRYILMIIGGSCSILSCLCGMCYKCSKYNAASREEVAAGYPAVQYQTATQGDTGYQPSAGFRKTGFNGNQPVPNSLSNDSYF